MNTRDRAPGGGGSSSEMPESHVEESATARESPAEPHTGHAASAAADSQVWPFGHVSEWNTMISGFHSGATRNGASKETFFFVTRSVTITRSVKSPSRFNARAPESPISFFCFTSAGFSL